MSKNKTSTFVAILSLSLLLQALGTVNSALQSIAQAFPSVPFTTILLVSSLPSILVIPFSIISGALAGTKVKYRSLVFLGLVLFVLGGAAPVFINDFTSVLISRAVFGVGLGIIFPLSNALILRLFEEKERANKLGIANIIQNVGAVILQLSAGVLCAINWHYTFLAFLLGILSFVIVLFGLPEPEKVQKINGEKVKLPSLVYVLSLLIFVCFLLALPIMYSMSTIIEKENIGNPAAAGIVISMFTVGGMIGGALFGTIVRVFGRFTNALALLLAGVGLVITYFGHDMVLLSLGSAIAGLGVIVIVPGVIMVFNKIVPPAGIVLALGIQMAALNLGSFVTPYYMALLAQLSGQTSMRFPFIFGAIGLIVLALGYGLLNLKTPAKLPAGKA